jgi:heme-degrading monooxygenase HmoA
MIRAMIERHLKEGKTGELIDLLKEIRCLALHQPGFVNGETLANTEDPFIVTVVCTWRSMEDWQAWEQSKQRMEVEKRIEALLRGKPKISTHKIMASE